MNISELEAMLRRFLSDQKLSSNEREVLSQWVQQNGATDQQRGVARAKLFDLARHVIGNPTAGLVLTFVEDVLKLLAPISPPASAANPSPISADTAYFSPGTACLDRILFRLNQARRHVDICVFTITDNRITRAILDAHKRGLKIRIITDNDKANDPGSDVDRLYHAGIPVVTDRTECHMHHKFAIFDGSRLLNGSYNWTRSAADENEENIVDTGNADLIRRFQQEFDELWKKLG